MTVTVLLQYFYSTVTVLLQYSTVQSVQHDRAKKEGTGKSELDIISVHIVYSYTYIQVLYSTVQYDMRKSKTEKSELDAVSVYMIYIYSPFRYTNTRVQY